MSSEQRGILKQNMQVLKCLRYVCQEGLNNTKIVLDAIDLLSDSEAMNSAQQLNLISDFRTSAIDFMDSCNEVLSSIPDMKKDCAELIFGNREVGLVKGARLASFAAEMNKLRALAAVHTTSK